MKTNKIQPAHLELVFCFFSTMTLFLSATAEKCHVRPMARLFCNNLISSNGAIELRGDFSAETLWANRMQMGEMFSVNPQVISKHIHNIYKEKELNKKATSSKMELVQSESGRTAKRQVDIYNLDILIAVGYRINSIIGTKFRQWATKTLREHITKGGGKNWKV